MKLLESSFSHRAWYFQFIAKTDCSVEVLTSFCGFSLPLLSVQALRLKVAVHKYYKYWGDIMALQEVVSICKEELFWWPNMPGCLLQRTWIFESQQLLKAHHNIQKWMQYLATIATTRLTWVEQALGTVNQWRYGNLFRINMLEVLLLGQRKTT